MYSTEHPSVDSMALLIKQVRVCVRACVSVGVENALSLTRKWLALKARKGSLDPLGIFGCPTVPQSLPKYLYDTLTLSLCQERETVCLWLGMGGIINCARSSAANVNTRLGCSTGLALNRDSAGCCRLQPGIQRYEIISEGISSHHDSESNHLYFLFPTLTFSGNRLRPTMLFTKRITEIIVTGTLPQKVIPEK